MSSRTLADLDADSLAHCASFLKLQDISNLAMTCKLLRRVSYSDSVWSRLFRECWPWQSLNPGLTGVRDAYLARRVALQQFKFSDPLEINRHITGVPPSHIMLNKDDIVLAQGSSVQTFKIDTSAHNLTVSEQYRAHNARITCMRLSPLGDISLYRYDVQNQDTVLITSSADHTIRVWLKGRCLRCFKGHNGPVTTLADKLLGDSPAKVLASGGEDGTVRLWSLSSSGKRHPRTTTLYGHEKQVSLLSVAGHNSSLLASISKDAKMRVWDASATASSVSRSSSCVGMASVSGQPVDMKCHEATCYIGAGSSVSAIDLRTMQKVFSVGIHPMKLFSLGLLLSKSLICTGGKNKAMLWDIRKPCVTEPIADLDGHSGNVTMIHIDPYKIVTGGEHDIFVNVWETDTGALANSLPCCPADETENFVGLSNMAVNWYRIATTCWGGTSGLVYFKDFSYGSVPKTSDRWWPSSKFWEPQCSSDAE